MRPDLRPYAPRGCLEWLSTDPEARHRAEDGTLVFVDISGFTAMSERLARLGRVGAEEVTDLLNHTFSRLLAVAYEDDGSLLKFGGDALLLLFEAHEHTARGVHAAAGMRRKLRALQPLQSSAGQVRLRMSIGVHTGIVEQLLVGSDHRELLVLGPTASEVVRMEGIATAGQIVVSGAVVEAMAGRLSAVPKDGGFLVRGEPQAPLARRRSTQPPGDAALAARLLSDQVRRQLERGAVGGEHHPSVVAFVKVLGTDDLLASKGAERAAAVLERVIDTVVEAAAVDDVCLLSTDVDASGVKLILTAGVPMSHEFDGERMLRALRRIVEADLPLDVKIGVHHGPVFAGVIGPPFRLTYTIIGDAVNLAARVMGRAEPGEILATPEVLNRSQALFDITAIEPFQAKGKKHPVTAYRVGPITGSRARRPRARFRLAGRDAELAAILADVDAASHGGGRVVHITGEAGIGKSRLLDEVQERRSEVPLTLAACSRYESTTPYFLVGQLLRKLLDVSPDASAEQLAEVVLAHRPDLERALPLLGDVMGVPVPDNATTRDLTAAFRAARSVDAVCRLLEAVVPEPAILVLEDLHWVDPESLTVVATLVQEVVPRRRWALLVTSRNPAVLDRSAGSVESEVALSPLTDADAQELVFAAVEDGSVSLDRGRQLLERAGGNPFFLEELLRFGDEEDLPDDVEALVQMQLDQLSHDARELLAHAAVLGADIDVALLEATAGIPASQQRVAFAGLDDFVQPNGDRAFRFRHALMHDAAYGRLPFRRRRELHLRAADALRRRFADDPRPDLLAIHSFQAREWEQARSYGIDAAEQASARFANLTAAALYRRAIEAGRHVRGMASEELATTWERLGEALMRASSYDEAIRAYQQSRRLAPPDRHARLCGQLGQLRERQGRYGEALRWFSRGVALGGDDTARLLVESAVVRARQGKPKEARRLADRAGEVAADPSTRGKVAYVRAWCAMLEGTDGTDDQQRSLELFEAVDDLLGQGLSYNIISMSAYYRGDWDQAAAAYERAAMLRRRVGDEVAAAAANGNLGELLADQGHFERARGLLEECRVVCGAAGFRSSRYFASMTLGRLDARVGRFDEAHGQIVEALEAYQEMAMRWYVFDARRYLAELHLFRGDLDAALAEADAVEEAATLGSAGFRSVAHRLRTGVAVASGDERRAESAALALLERLDHSALDYDTALGFVAAAVGLEHAGHEAALRTRAMADAAMARLGVIVPGELLVFGPCSPLAAGSPAGRADTAVLVP